MILKSEIEQVCAAQRKQLANTDVGVERALIDQIRLDTGMVLIVSGIRRCGKSTLLKQLMGDKLPDFRYLNFEDPRLTGFDLNDMIKLDEILLSGETEPWLVFDEIQVIEGWEKYIRNKQDQGVKVILSGSNASMLSRELGTRLTGRYLSYELFPFSYAEFLKMRNDEPGPYSFQNYLSLGGFPEYLKSQEDEILFRIADDILYRDIAVRHGIRHPHTLRQMLVYLISNSGKTFSYNNLKKLFGLGSPNTVRDYISFFDDGYLLFTIPKYSFSLKKQQVNPRKVYTIDTGLAGVNSLSFSSDLGRKLENLVFLHLRRRYRQIFYYSDRYECDFLVAEKGKLNQAIQVCYELNSDNLDREINGLVEALASNKIIRGLILTYNQTDILKKEGFTIQVMPAGEWMLKKVYEH